jgi:hypothetical protein
MTPAKAILVGALVAMSACEAPRATGTSEISRDAVVYSIRQVPEGDSCRTVFPVTYPADIPPHEIVFPFDAVGSPWGRERTISVPFAPDHSHDIVRNADGTVSTIAGTTANGCAPRTWDFDASRCVSGDCPPIRFVESDQMGTITMRRTGG